MIYIDDNGGAHTTENSSTDIIITNPAQWRAGDKVTIEGTLVSTDGEESLRLGVSGPYVRSGIRGHGLASTLRDETITVTVRRPVQPLPDKPGDVFYATVDGEPNTQVMVLAVPDLFFCVFPSGSYGTRLVSSIYPSTVRRVRVVPEDEQ